MKFPKYWTKGSARVEDRRGRTHEFSAWGWSDISLADAERKGRERATNIGSRVLDDDPPDHYTYGPTPTREEVTREYRDAAGQLRSAITANSYGCQVLNTTAVMFVDIDWRPVAVGTLEAVICVLKHLVGIKAAHPGRQREAALLAAIERMSLAGNRSIRVYRTKAGVRCMFCDYVPPPASDEARRFMESLGADRLYIRLCRVQESYRARLTPKPWRCGLQAPHMAWPWLDSAKKDEYERWRREYERVSSDYATCQLLGQYGRQVADGHVAEMISLHDSMTRATSDLPLA
jgi:hypothetical protein